ncbi:MAG: GH3 auxin-responsive promoter family protein [Flavobacteriales bacterium]
MLLNFSGKIVGFLIRQRIYQIKDMMENPVEKQHNTLNYLLNKADSTVFGKKYHFNKIENYHTFKSEIPLATYEDLLPYFDEIALGKKDILWPGKMEWFAKSSGTTSAKSKYIPVSDQTIKDCHFKGGKDLLTLYEDRYNSLDLYSGKTLLLGGSHGIGEFSSVAKQGDLSAIIIENLPYWVYRRQCPEKETALLSEWEEKLKRIAEESIHEDIRSISGVPSWTVVVLRLVLEITQKKHIKDVWPNLELLMHGGVSIEPYRKEIEKLMGKKINFQETYNASEGFFAIQDLPERNDMLLMLDYGIFYEFIPIAEIYKENPNVLALEDVKLNEVYALVISTNSGLWRYNIGDTIEFTSIDPYRIKIVGRTKQFINTFGEELMVANAEKAIAICCNLFNVEIIDYTAGPKILEEGACGVHQWAIEFKNLPENLEIFSKKLDSTLQELNSDYQSKRYKNYVLKPLEIIVIESNGFYKWLKSKNKLGGQHKVPRLSNSLKYIEELIDFQGNLK